MAYVSDRSIAEEVVQETWIGVLEGLERFEGRSSLKTWIFRILTNKAKTRGIRESRHVSFSPLGSTDDGSDEPVVDHAGAHLPRLGGAGLGVVDGRPWTRQRSPPGASHRTRRAPTSSNSALFI